MRSTRPWISAMRSKANRVRSARRPRRLLTVELLEERIAPWAGNVFDTTPGVPLWTNNQVQVITGDVDVPAGKTLTVQAGTVVQFDSGTSLTVDGTLVAQGTSNQTIYFTSVKDNSPTGGSNTAAPGDWSQIQFKSDSTGDVLDNVVVRYGSNSMIEADSAAPSISNSTISNSSGDAVLLNSSNASFNTVTIQNNAGDGMHLSGSSPTLTAMTITNNTGNAIEMDAGSNPTVSGSLTKNAINGVAIDDGTISTDTTWNSPGIVYVVTGVTVASNVTLTIDAGQLVKAKPGFNGLDVHGTLDVDGTTAAPVYFTSLKDDTIGGDTNNDGNATSPAPGDWNGLYFETGSTGALDHIVVRYGGSDQRGDVEINANVSVTNSTLIDSSQAGLRIDGSTPTVTGDVFQGNKGAAIAMDATSAPSVVVNSPSDVSGNGTNGVAIDDGTISANTTWNSPSIVYVVTSTVTVASGATLDHRRRPGRQGDAGLPRPDRRGNLECRRDGRRADLLHVAPGRFFRDSRRHG